LIATQAGGDFFILLLVISFRPKNALSPDDFTSQVTIRMDGDTAARKIYKSQRWAKARITDEVEGDLRRC